LVRFRTKVGLDLGNLPSKSAEGVLQRSALSSSTRSTRLVKGLYRISWSRLLALS